MPTTLAQHELLQPIRKVAQRLTGRRPAPATVWRWLRKGVRGVKLDGVLLGGTWLCTEDDFRRFLDEQTAAALAPSRDAVTDEQLQAEGLI